MKASVKKHILEFKNPAGTSRGILNSKETWYLILEQNGQIGIGECSPIWGLSFDDRSTYEACLSDVCNKPIAFIDEPNKLQNYPSIRFGLETALLDLAVQGTKLLFPGSFIEGASSIDINGLIWMGDPAFMRKQIRKKIKDGFHCLKMKIGAIDFEEELSILKEIRTEFKADDLELRVDANGAFQANVAIDKLNALAKYDLHSIEQPIMPGQLDEMNALCKESPIPIAFDEELIGVFGYEKKRNLLDAVKPQYIILKPSLIGGFEESKEWIDLAEEMQIDWWLTSALESNIGLNAITQWTSTLNNKLPQGLGTGGLYTNNIQSPLYISEGKIHYNKKGFWDLSMILNSDDPYN